MDGRPTFASAAETTDGTADNPVAKIYFYHDDQIAFSDFPVLIVASPDDDERPTTLSATHSESTIRARLDRNLKELNARPSRCTLSISLGAARFDPTSPRSPASIEQLMIRADEAMYEEKRLRSKPFLVTGAD